MPYTTINNTYIPQPKTDVNDRIDVEVGDSKQTDFLPQLKLMRWDNEVNFSIRLSSAVVRRATLTENIISWDTPAIAAKFYELPASGQLPDGGYEFEVILKKKPPTNKVTFSIQTKGLEFYYQGELTAAEIAAGAMRADDMVGSYAVYYAVHPLNYEGGKLYRTGKAFHIRRPRVVDAAGKVAWGDLHIDLVAGTMTVTLPQDFLNSATYPVTHAAGLTIGYETAGATLVAIAANNWRANRVYPSTGCDVSKVTMYTRAYNSVNFKAVITIGGGVDTIIDNGVGDSCARSGGWGALFWQDCTYTTHPILTASNYYYLGAVISAAATWAYDTGLSNAYAYGSDDSNDFTTPTDPTDGTYAETVAASFYATYTLPTSIKTVQGLVKASVKTVQGLAIASVKTIQGLA